MRSSSLLFTVACCFSGGQLTFNLATALVTTSSSSSDVVEWGGRSSHSPASMLNISTSSEADNSSNGFSLWAEEAAGRACELASVKMIYYPMIDRMHRAFIQTEGCTVKYDYSTCTFEVFHPKNPNIHCSYGAVGK